MNSRDFPIDKVAKRFVNYKVSNTLLRKSTWIELAATKFEAVDSPPFVSVVLIN